jgi:type IV fimbrial biogenesis protein FimT
MQKTPHTGFTIIEVMITVGILAIFVSLAAPSMKAFMDTQSVKTPATDLYASLILARSEAIKRNSAVDLVPTNAGDWAQGWQVKVQSGGTVLRVQDQVAIVTILASTPGNLTYGSNGRLVTAATLFRVTIPGNSNIRMRCVSVDPSGRPNVRIDGNTDPTTCD